MNVTSSPNLNHLWADLMIEELVRNGVDTFCISPGSRSTPLTLAVARNPKAKGFVHFDERGSAFRALGIASATGRPCAVITTSGTAAANLFPAVIEASKKKLPLIMLTADRPPELRFTGAHQTIDQVKMYGDYVRWHFDLPCPTAEIPAEFVLTTISQAVSRATGNPGGPVHINCMYREPLAPVRTRSTWGTYTKTLKNWKTTTEAYTKYIKPKSGLRQSDIDHTILKVRKIKSGIIVAGKLKNLAEQRNVLRLADKLRWPVFADISSGLRLGNTDKNVIHYFDQILLSEKFKKDYQPDGILHLGGRMTSKRWHEYLKAADPSQYIMAISHPLRNDPPHKVTTRVQCDVASFCRAIEREIPQRKDSRLLLRLQKLNKKVHHQIDVSLKDQSGLSEPQAARLITASIPSNDGLFIASSMPVREIDMYGTPDKNKVVFGSNRGASGIDGTIATAIGFSTGLNNRCTLLIGDLAFLHDLNSMAMLRDLAHPMVIVIVNNNGGGIFSFLPVRQCRENFEKYFGTPHDLTFSAAADLFDLNYARPETGEEFAKTYNAALKNKVTTIIEITTDRAYNLKMHNAMQHTIKAAINREFK